jgi:enterochelin esterase-like enzyme
MAAPSISRPSLAPPLAHLDVSRLGGLLSRLAYSAASGRDLRLDFLRGFAVFAMVVDHLAGPSKLYLLTGGNQFFTSAAEAFVLISGLVVGVVYRQLAERDGLGVAVRRLLERTWALYVLAVGLTLAVLPLSEMLRLPWAQGIDLSDPILLVWRILTLHQTYYLVDVPLLYTLLLAVSPVALILLHERRAWAVLGVSWLVWAVYQVYPDQGQLLWDIHGNYLFFFAAWQVLFFTGMVAGYHRARISRAIPTRWRAGLLLATGIGFLSLLALFTNSERLIMAVQSLRPGGLVGGYSLTTDLLDVWFAKASLGPGRLLASAVVFTFLYLLTSALWVAVRRAFGWLLLPLGQNALFAYSAHVVAATFIGMLAIFAGLNLQRNPTLSLLLQVISLAALWLAIRHRFLVPNPETRRIWMAATVPLAIVVVLGVRLDGRPDMAGVEGSVVPAADAGVRPVASSDGAPVSRQAERARRFGTPVPRDRQGGPVPPGGTAASPAGTPVPVPSTVAYAAAEPLPAPDPRLAGAHSAGATPRVSAYVGDTKGTFLERGFYSPALDLDMPYYVYLPPSYGEALRRFPVLYMLHGGSGDRDEWPAYGLIDAVDRLIASREIRPMIVVLPQGDYGYWVNHVDNGRRWGDYISQDLIKHIDSTYRTLPDRDHRAVGGLSMGGYGALQLALTATDVFHGVGAHSPALFPDDGSLPVLGSGEEFAQRDPVMLAESAEGLDRLDILLDIGEEDHFVERAMDLHDVLERRGIEHRWLLQPGGHEGIYWERHLLLYLRFYDEVLHWRSGGFPDDM